MEDPSWLLHSKALLWVFCLWCLQFVAFRGWGLALERALSCRWSPCWQAWAGWGLFIVVLQLLHLWVPITFVVGLTYLGLGCCWSFVFKASHHRPSEVLGLHWLWRGYKRWGGVKSVPLYFLLGLFALWVASRSMLSPTVYDTGLYHLQSIRWSQEFPLVPGLGNLHFRLAFNQSHFLYVAALNFHPYFEQGRCVTHSFMLILACFTFATPLWKALMDRSLCSTLAARPCGALMQLCLLLGLLFVAFSSRGLHSPAPDLTSLLLQMLMFSLLCEVLAKDTLGWSRSQVYLTAILMAVSLTIKLSQLAFVVGLGLLMILGALISHRGRMIHRLKPLLMPCLLFLFIFAVWAYRGYISSGMPLFPSPLIAFDVEWAVPHAVAVDARDGVYSWAKNPGADPKDVLGNWKWFEPWLWNMLRLKTLVFSLIVGMVMGLGAVIWILKAPRPKQWLPALMFVPIALGFIFWFLTAPTPRFANALFILQYFAILMFAASCLQARCVSAHYQVCVMLFVLLAAAPLVGHLILKNRKLQEISLRGFQKVQEVELYQSVSDFGVQVWVPKRDDRVWNSTLPATPYPNAKLRCIGEDFSSGFSVREP